MRPIDASGSSRQLSTRFQIKPVAMACSALLMMSGGAQSQTAAGTEAQSVVVTGIRRSLETSLGLKRDARGLVDGIVAEDIGKFPDTNLAESMQRISGVSIDRSIGEGSKITVRGLGPDHNLVLLNGRQMPTASLADTSASNSRAFDFANLASESIAALEVYKTSRSENPVGGIGATVNIKTARPLDTNRMVASFGIKGVMDDSNKRLPDSLKGSQVTPELSGIYSNSFANGTFGVSLSGSYQKRDLGYNQAAVTNGWRTFAGDTNDWGTIPQNGTPGSERITNRPGAKDIYSVPQNLNYNVNGIQRERTNGQLTLQHKPAANLTTTLDYTYSENKLQNKRNELSAWFNFGASTSSWTNGPVAAPKLYSEIINGTDPKTAADIAMGGAQFGTKNQNKSTGFNVDWKVSDRLRLELDLHSSTATSGADSPYGTNAVLGTASYNRGTTTADFTNDFPVLSIDGKLDASLMQVTGSAFRNSYTKSGVDQAQFRGKFKLDEVSKLNFGLSATQVENKSAFTNVQRDTWGGASSPADYPDSVWKADTLRQYFGRISGSGSPALFNQFYVWDFKTVRDLAAKAAGNEALYQASFDFNAPGATNRTTTEKSQSAYLQYSRDWEWMVPMGATFGVRYEKTDVTSSALVPVATGVSWGSANELSVQYGALGFTTLKGSYNYLLPSIDFDAELTDRLKLRLSYGESIGRPGWGDIQGGQTLNQLVRVNGGNGEEGNPGLKPLKSRNTDLSLEYYYAKGSYLALGYFNKNIDNYVGITVKQGTPFNITTPIGGALYKDAVANGGAACAALDLVCIRNFIFAKYDGQKGVNKAAGTIVGQPGDPVTVFAIRTPANQQAASLRGLEANVQHAFGKTGFGVGANYTKVMSGLKYNDAGLGEQFALEGLSDSANLVGFYEDDKFNVRVAYNWRGEFLTARFDGSGTSNPVYTEPYGQVDVSMGYKFNEKLSFQAEFINLNDGIQRLHGRAKEEVIAVTQTGRRYQFGMRYKF